MDELSNRVEAILFASGKGVTEEELAHYCESNTKAIKKALAQLQKNLEERNGSLIVSLHNNRWKMTVRGKYLKDVENIVSETELSGSILRTLAVVAFKSPVLQSDVVNMRGQSAYEHIKELTKQKFITKEERGRSYLLKITDKFYNYFDVEGDEEIQDVFAKLREKQKKLGELQIVDADKENKEEKKDGEDKEHLGDLDVVDIAPRTREKTEEDEREEKEFLTRIDEDINAISKRIDEDKLPKRQQKEENEEPKKEETEKKEEKSSEEKKNVTEEDPLKAMEKIAKEYKKEEEKDYL